jgi:hypothetical protein
MMGFDDTWCTTDDRAMNDEMHPFPSLHLEMLPHGLGRPSPSHMALWRLDVTTCVASMIAFLHFYDL